MPSNSAVITKFASITAALHRVSLKQMVRLLHEARACDPDRISGAVRGTAEQFGHIVPPPLLLRSHAHQAGAGSPCNGDRDLFARSDAAHQVRRLLA